MEALYQKFEILLQNTTTDFKRYLYHKVAWDSLMKYINTTTGHRS